MSFTKAVRAISYRHDLWTVWRDFMEMAAISLAVVDIRQRAEREERYMTIIKRYEPAEQPRFAEAFGVMVQEFEDSRIDDVLGRAFMDLELGSKWAGQFFTPFEVCRVMARLQIDGMADLVKERGFVTACDPAVGAGAMILALCKEMLDAGLNYQQVLHVTAQDIDERAAHMCFIQFALWHVPAVIAVGDTLRMETRAVWYTPAHIMGGWSWRLAQRAQSGEPQEEESAGLVPAPADEGRPTDARAKQLVLF